MEGKTIYGFRYYLEGKKIALTEEEKKFLQNISGNLTLEDLINWLKSDIRTMPEIINLLQNAKLTREQFLAISKLDSFSLANLVSKFGDSKESLTIALVGDAYLYRYIIIDNNVHNDEYNQQIIENLISSHGSDKLNKIELIRHTSIYHNPSLVSKIIERDSLSSEELALINELLNKIEPYSSDIASKYVSLILDKKPKQIEEVDPNISPSDIARLDKRKRAKDAILCQDSFDKMKEVIYASLNNGIYRKKDIFYLIQREKDERKMRILRILATHNRLRKNAYYLAFVSGLDLENQEKILEFIGETDRKIKHAKMKALRHRRSSKYTQ